jgi:hypothetical protein
VRNPWIAYVARNLAYVVRSLRTSSANSVRRPQLTYVVRNLRTSSATRVRRPELADVVRNSRTSSAFRGRRPRSGGVVQKGKMSSSSRMPLKWLRDAVEVWETFVSLARSQTFENKDPPQMPVPPFPQRKRSTPRWRAALHARQ